MTMAGNAANAFTNGLISLWGTPLVSTTIYDTADLIEEFWSNARVTGSTAIPNVFARHISYPGFAAMDLDPVDGDPATAALSFETALSQMVIQTIFPAVPPQVTVPPPTATGYALSGVLSADLEDLFGDVSLISKAPSIAPLIVNYLAAWTILVSVPPGTPASVPII